MRLEGKYSLFMTNNVETYILIVNKYNKILDEGC